MDLKENELKIFYSGGPNKDLEDKLKELLGAFGYDMWASGMDIQTGVRDLAFDRYGYNIIDNEGDKVFRFYKGK